MKAKGYIRLYTIKGVPINVAVDKIVCFGANVISGREIGFVEFSRDYVIQVKETEEKIDELIDYENKLPI